jgi:adenylate kinase family enzyme
MKKISSGSKNPLNIILLGDIAAGKATQVALLLKKYPLYDLDMGKELRRPALRTIGRYSETAGRGIVSPTSVVRGIFKKRIASTSSSKGILFNGTPKMIGEARLVHRLLKECGRTNVIFIYISIPYSEMAKRSALRWQKEKRTDDLRDGMRRRWTGYYRKHIYGKIIPYFAKIYPYKKISGMGSIKEVWKRLDKEVEKFSTE